MRIKDTLERDPSTHPLTNQGQARITDRSDDRTWQELRAELATFVCEGQYQDGLQRILSSYLTNLTHTSQKGAWVSGFYGSGKSHLLKMLCHLWQNTTLPDGTLARDLVPTLPAEVRAQLKELDTEGKRRGGLFAAAGALPSGTSSHVRQTILGLVLRSAGLPDKYAQARFALWLEDRGHADAVRQHVEAAGKTWESELNDLYVSKLIAKALLDVDPDFATSEAEARATIKAQFGQPTTDITTSDFLAMLRRVLELKGRDGRPPCTVIVLDEVQQYIGNSVERSSLVSEVAEAISKELGGAAIVVAAGQSALSDSKDLQRLMDRFTVRVALSDTDVEAVTRKVLLQKKPSAVTPIRAMLDKHAGEVSRQLQGSRIGETTTDVDVIVDDYPLLPVRRRFWEHCFRQVDLAGTQSQLRSQLSIIHSTVARIADQQLGAVIPADELFEQLAPAMVNTGVLLREINENIVNLRKDGSSDSVLASRLCGLIFLICKLPREAGADIGVRATREHLADLVVEDIAADNGALRTRVGNVLDRLADDGTLLRVGDGEFRLQTREGTEWDKEFRNRRTKLLNSAVDVHARRDQLLYAELDRVIRSVRVMQGAARVVRPLAIHQGDTPPPGGDEMIRVWARDRWSSSEKEHVSAAQRAGLDSSTVFVFIDKLDAEEFQEAIVEAEAARQTLDYKGAPNTDEGEEARRAMDTRRTLAERQRDVLVKRIVERAKVFQGGGSEVLQLSLEDKIRTAAEAAVVRLFPEFTKADAIASAWEAAIKRSREGADNPFQSLNYTGTIEQHPVAQRVLQAVGAGKIGSEIRKSLRAAPYGWPQDAIDAALIALHRGQHVSAMLNGAPVAPGQLDQNRIAKSEFRVERTILTVQDKMAIRRLFKAAGVNFKPNDESAAVPDFLRAYRELARNAGGDAPLPPPPDARPAEEIERLIGTEQLAGMRDRAVNLERDIKDWSERATLARERLAEWNIVRRLAHHAEGLGDAADALKQVIHIEGERLLLEPTNPLPPLRSRLTNILRGKLTAVHARLEEAYASAIVDLEANSTWAKTSPQARESILADVGLVPPGSLAVGSDEALLYALDSRGLGARAAVADAVQARAQRALEAAARLAEPAVQPITLDRATLRSKDEVHLWVTKQQAVLLEAVERGPVLIR